MSKKKQSIISKWQYATITLSLLSIIAAFSIFFHSKGSLVTSASEEMIDPELMSKCENYLVGYLYKSKHPEVKWEVPASELLELWLRECSGFRITLPSYASSALSLPSSL
ncbi:MAG TPA: hypothetical protein VEA59_06965, partial [Patescibacteria group bacterium]|nr:hypothetical protein [Patescibacteria group bacterium]